MPESEVLSIIQAELDNANFSDTEAISTQLETALGYYLGAPNGKETVGRSTVTSTDVADAIEWIMPQVMESLIGQSDIVEFVPNGQRDVLQAQLETEYVHDVILSENDGYVKLYTFVKDALLQRNGLLKVYVAEEDYNSTVSYSGLTIEQVTALAAIKTNELQRLQAYEETAPDGATMVFHDVTVAKHERSRCVKIENVPLERFRVNSQHNSLDLSTARFTAHIERTTVSELAGMGFDEALLMELPSYNSFRSEYRYRLQGEVSNTATLDSEDASLAYVEVAECFMRMDINKDGIAELVKVTVASDGGSVQKLLLVELIDDMPWVSTTGIIMGHKFQGLSIFDRLKEIQDQKTALMRNLLDNLYLQNNQRVMAVENQVTLDDLMVSRPGGVVRVKRIDAVAPLLTPQIAQEAFTMLDYLDRVRAGRSGVDAEGSASPKSMGDAVGSEGVDRLLNAKEALVGLIVRTIAETGVKPLCCKVRDLLHQHVDSIRDFEFRGQWVQVNPSEWVSRRRTRVKVGSGTGDRRSKMAALQVVLQSQRDILAANQPIVSLEKVYNALDDFCKLTGLLSGSKYFVDPASDEGKQLAEQTAQQAAQEQEKVIAGQLMTLKAEQQFANAEQLKAQSMLENSRIKAQEVIVRGQLERSKVENMVLKQQFDQIKALQDSIHNGDKLALERFKAVLDGAIRITEIEANTLSEQNDNFESNQSSVKGAQSDRYN
jgi:hypothetical protein